MNLDERIDTQIDEMFTRRQMQLNEPYRKMAVEGEREQFKQLLRDVLEYVKPDGFIAPGEAETRVKIGENEFYRQFGYNLCLVDMKDKQQGLGL